jgi:hypothetical protein
LSSAPDVGRRRVIHPPSVWLGRLKQELVSAGIGHDQAGIVALRVVNALIPTDAKLEAEPLHSLQNQTD